MAEVMEPLARQAGVPEQALEPAGDRDPIERGAMGRDEDKVGERVGRRGPQRQGLARLTDPVGDEAFKSGVRRFRGARCAGGGGHASPIAVLYLACGDTEEELRWNFHITTRHLNRPAVQSDILRRPLASIALRNIRLWPASSRISCR